MLKKINAKECILCAVMIGVIALTTGINYFSNGLAGYLGDLMYHLLRIEAVKDALLSGSYPARVNPLFFNGYGYGSSLFYPDIFLVVPALLRMIGVSPSVAFKLYVLFLAAVGTVTTYLSFKYILKNRYYAAAGTFLLMLSQFYIADILQRVGLSEYTAFIFIPVLVAGIYDFVACEGKKVYLIGIAFVGLVLSHTIMTVVGLLVTVLVFGLMLLVPARRKNMLQWKKLLRLLGVAVLSVLAVAYYAFPMLEQMVHDKFIYMEPWAEIGEFTQPFEVFFNPVGRFNYIAYIGVGVPILVLLGSRLLLGRPKNKWADFFLFGGILILLATTDIVPWARFNDTFLNMLQFTFRLYPYALCFMVLGLMLYFSEKCQENQMRAMILISVLAVGFGTWQSVESYHVKDNEKRPVSLEMVQRNNYFVGRGEWFPQGVKEDVYDLSATQNVFSSTGEIAFARNAYNDYSFEKSTTAAEEFVVPLIYYKGYQACLIAEDGTEAELAVSRTADALVKVSVPEGVQGTVKVWYGGTWVQTASNLVSLFTVIALVGYGICRYGRRFGSAADDKSFGEKIVRIK